MWNGQVPHLHVVDKIREGYLKSEEFQAHTGHPSPGFQCQKSPHNFWLQKPAGIDMVEVTTGVPSNSS